jgi:hypothetical protein
MKEAEKLFPEGSTDITGMKGRKANIAANSVPQTAAPFTFNTQ